MEISVRNEAMCTVIAVTGRLDTRTAPEWEKQCGDIIQSVLIKSLNPSNKIPQLNLGTGILKI